MAMKLSTGKVAFPIEFDNGDKDCIYFNPSDPALATRMQALQDKVNKKISEVEDIAITPEGKPEDEGIIDTFVQIQKVVCDELDIALGGEVSAVAFKHCSPFALVDGEYFLVQFINAILPEIDKHIKKAKAQAEKKMAKHLDKYKK